MRAAEEAGASEDPQAAPYLALARRQIADADREIALGNYGTAERLLRTAQANSELAAALAREASARAEAAAMRSQAEAARAQAAAAAQRARAEAQQRQAAEQEQTRMLRERELALQTQIDLQRAEREKAERARLDAERERDRAFTAMRELGEVAERTRGVILTIPGEVMFRDNQAELLPRAKEKLDELADALQRLGPDQSFVIEGHTDSRGSESYNRQLSRERALAVRAYLIQRGVDPDIIQAVGRGEDEPVASNATPEGRANNRRVEIIVTPPAVSRR